MAVPVGVVTVDDEDYEICNDDGFVYRRRLGLYPDVAPPSAQAADPEAEAARLRRRRRALLRLRDKRRRELAEWEALGEKIQAMVPTPEAPPASPRADTSAPSVPDDHPRASPASPLAETSTPSVLDDLLSRVRMEGAILKKLTGLCDDLDALWRAREEEEVDEIMALPVWDDPKELLMSLQSPDSPDTSDLNFRKDYQNEGNGTFQMLDSRQGKRAIDAGGFDGYQEAEGVSPAAVQMIQESGKTMKSGPYHHKRCFETGHTEKTCHETPPGLGVDLSTLSVNRKKKVVASLSGSKSVKKPMRFNLSVSSDPRPTIRSAAAKMCNQDVSS